MLFFLIYYRIHLIAYGNIGHENKNLAKVFRQPNGESKSLELELFICKKRDYVVAIKNAF
jgi:S-adenosylmethionine synthetase